MMNYDDMRINSNILKNEKGTAIVTRNTILNIINDFNSMIRSNEESVMKLQRLLEHYPLTKKVEVFKHKPADEIIATVNHVFDTDCRLKTRHRRVTDSRHCVCSLLRTYTDLSHKEIGEYLSTYADHTTVISSVKKCKSLLEVDDVFKNKYNQCKEIIEGRLKINQ
jgi:chromosomal replication initiation ATPase DnaA